MEVFAKAKSAQCVPNGARWDGRMDDMQISTRSKNRRSNTLTTRLHTLLQYIERSFQYLHFINPHGRHCVTYRHIYSEIMQISLALHECNPFCCWCMSSTAMPFWLCTGTPLGLRFFFCILHIRQFVPNIYRNFPLIHTYEWIEDWVCQNGVVVSGAVGTVNFTVNRQKLWYIFTTDLC